ncbi:hypothetical protein AMTRI_Chr06g199120 [Amborella trichopoda]
MKFMKLGNRPDTFYTAEAVRSVSSEVTSDLVIQVRTSRYLLHKFPLLSKCGRLQKFCIDQDTTQDPIELPDFPGGAEAFELCAKFCYGIIITLSALNIVAVRCGAEYLEMTESIEKGNLIYKLDVFLNSCVLRGWKDSIIVLSRTKGFPHWCESLKITSRCIDSIASRVLMNPLKINWSFSHSKGREDIHEREINGTESRRHRPNSKGWWAEDLSELSIDLYWRIMVAIKSGNKVPQELIGEALQVYAYRWLPGFSKEKPISEKSPETLNGGDITSKHRLLLETIVSLLPIERGSISCSFLLKLIKAANILSVSQSTKMELARRVGLQLEEASVSDLLIPSLSHSNEMLYDVEMVQRIVENFMLQAQSPPVSPPRTRREFYEKRRSRSAEDLDFQESRRASSASHGSKLRVAKLIDLYLQEIARDINLPLEKVIELAEAVPDFARPEHDDLYKAVDIYLKAHPNLSKSERKRLCRLLDCKKLSMEACMHAAQNELLPLRLVVQVLFFEQVRAATSGNGPAAELPHNLKALLSAHEEDGVCRAGEDSWSVGGLKPSKQKLTTLRMRLAEADNDQEDEVAMHDGGGCVSGGRNSSMLKAICSMPNRPKRMLSKLWSSNKSVSDKH